MLIASPAKSKSAIAAQEFLVIDSIRDGTVVLTDGRGLRAVVMVSSMNFALKSEEEQDATVSQYENLLNALDFPLQLVIHSRHLNINPYLDTLREREKEETNELLKVQISEYIEFVETFVELSNVVAKTFYVIVPFTPSIAETKGLTKGLLSLLGIKINHKTEDSDDKFIELRAQLIQKVDAVMLGLRRMGLRAAMLNTEELIELFYGLYNPTESQKISEVKTKP